MDRLMASPFYAWSRSIGAACSVFVGWYAALKDRKVAGLSSVDWLLLSLLSAMGVVLHQLTRIVLKLEGEQD
jgi:hypothetical protein